MKRMEAVMVVRVVPARLSLPTMMVMTCQWIKDLARSGEKTRRPPSRQSLMLGTTKRLPLQQTLVHD
jgi:hypothetical protein